MKALQNVIVNFIHWLSYELFCVWRERDYCDIEVIFSYVIKASLTYIIFVAFTGIQWRLTNQVVVLTHINEPSSTTMQSKNSWPVVERGQQQLRNKNEKQPVPKGTETKGGEGREDWEVIWEQTALETCFVKLIDLLYTYV